MTYKETLFFIAKCLTITHDAPNRSSIEQELQSGTVDWDHVVQVSTQHYVYPALYCNLQRAEFLQYLPVELVAHMEHITDLNRVRNQQIIAQATAINTLLLSNNITPIFLKGTANLLDNRYEDIAERMVGDIDFIVDRSDADQAVQLLLDDGYSNIDPLAEELTKTVSYVKHHPRMVKEGGINAIEVHLELTREAYRNIFNYKTIAPTARKVHTCSLCSYEHQIVHTLMNHQINDLGYLYKSIALRNYYDVFLLAQKENTLKSIETFPKIVKELNTFLAVASTIFSNTQSIVFKETTHVLRKRASILSLLDTPKKHQQRNAYLKKWVLQKTRARLLFKAFYSKPHFIHAATRLSDIRFYKRVFFNKN